MIPGRHPKCCPSRISHFLFADDMLIICNAYCDQNTLSCVLEPYYGLKVNLGKFELVAVGEVPHQEEVVNNFYPLESEFH